MSGSRKYIFLNASFARFSAASLRCEGQRPLAILITSCQSISVVGALPNAALKELITPARSHQPNLTVEGQP